MLTGVELTIGFVVMVCIVLSVTIICYIFSDIAKDERTENIIRINNKWAVAKEAPISYNKPHLG